MASRSPAGKPRPAGSPQPAHMLFQVGGQGFLLTRRFSRPAWARLIDFHQASSLPLLRQAARESVTFAARLRSTFGHDVAPLASRGRPADALERVATLIGQRRLFLFRLGEAPAASPKRVSQLRIDVVPAKPVAPESDAAPAPRDLPSRMLIVVEGMRDVPARELGEDAVELFATLAVAGMALRIAALLAAWIASHFTPVGWIVDVGMIGYGVWMVGVGFVDSMKRLLVIARDIQAARTRGELKRLSQPLAVLLVEAGLTAMLAFFLKGVDKRKRGSGLSREAAAAPTPPIQKKPAPVPGKQEPPATSPHAQPVSKPPSGLKPGPHAKESVPARGPGRDFTDAERSDVNRIFEKSGCHTCGTRAAGTSSGDAIPDHQPPSRLNSANLPQRLYPHCLACSRRQGGEVTKELMRLKGQLKKND